MDESIGMRYIEKVANGNAGEFYFAYWISSNFIWPCRILDIDMGLDAQVEIYDDQNHSTGMFIGVQVKTTAKTLKESPNVSVPLKNIVYWGSINDPVVIVRVCLNNNSKEPCLYWKHLQKSELENYLNTANEKGCETVSINFEEDKNLLQRTDKSAWLRLFLSDEDKDIIEGSESIKTELRDLGQYFEKNFVDEQLTNGFPTHYFPLELNCLLNRYDKLANAVKINPRLEYLSEEVKSTVECYESYITIILKAFKMGLRFNL
ncbi:DUF4365 domain-containing protein [Xenorhabdus sp. XENO-1]|uniref:DUF4365 domain-containing protein n=1 Tax=Xenorhabdus bovienii TaxID=40576 RepID=UPI0020CA4B7F|nr:DUF4365 domain-containing protein [Xenorhabdus bovienii]MCP9267642.1 DUF4365 domain-containing protein [Xenorhabdus bovienii subsp. africana]